MSHPSNTLWLEAAIENFDEALEAGNYSLAQDVIADMRDNGFSDDADYLQEVLLHTPVSIFNSN